MQAAHNAVGALDLGPGVGVLEQVGHGRRAAAGRQRLAYAEAEPARHGMAVGRDDAVGARVDAVAEPVAHPDGDLGRFAVRSDDLAVIHALAVLVVDADGAEADFDRLVEVELHLRRRVLDRLRTVRSGVREHGVAPRSRRPREQRDQREQRDRPS